MAPQPRSTVRFHMTPHLRVRDAAGAIAFYEKAFGAVVLRRLTTPNGMIVNALLSIAGAEFSLAEESHEAGAPGPQSLGGSPIHVDLVVPDADAMAEQAVAAGAVIQYEIADQFYGMRQGRLVDPFGHVWSIGTPIEDVPPAEMQRRLDEMVRSMG